MAGFVTPPRGVDPLDWVHCPNGHHVPRHKLAQFQESGLYTCDYKAPPGHGRPCNAQILVLYVYRREKGPDGHPVRKVYVAEVDWREMAHMEQQHLDVWEMIGWLGCRYDPPRPTGATRTPGRLR